MLLSFDPDAIILFYIFLIYKKIKKNKYHLIPQISSLCFSKIKAIFYYLLSNNLIFESFEPTPIKSPIISMQPSLFCEI